MTLLGQPLSIAHNMDTPTLHTRHNMDTGHTTTPHTHTTVTLGTRHGHERPAQHGAGCGGAGDGVRALLTTTMACGSHDRSSGCR